MLVQVVDKKNADPYVDVGCYKRGDVIVICPDGHPWSEAERTNPDWTILKVPGAVDRHAGLLKGEPGDPRLDRMLRRRAHSIDLDAPTFRVRQNPKIRDPNVID